VLLEEAFESNQSEDVEAKIGNLIFLIMSSPQYAIQR